jgi:hypothetical protein
VNVHHTKSRLIPEPLRTLRSEDKGQAGACSDRTRSIPCTVTGAVMEPSVHPTAADSIQLASTTLSLPVLARYSHYRFFDLAQGTRYLRRYIINSMRNCEASRRDVPELSFIEPTIQFRQYLLRRGGV